MTAYEKLMSFQRETEALQLIAGRLDWDQQTMMPKGAANQRGAEVAALEGVLHERRSDPRLAEWLEASSATDPVAKAQLRDIRRSYDRATKVPADLVRKLALATTLAQEVWVDARANEDVAAFLPALKEVVHLRREESAALADGGDLYDALVDLYEPGMTGDDIAAMFNAMRPRLTTLRAAILDQPSPQGIEGKFDTSRQLDMAGMLAKAFGYDMERGRIDEAVHPFSSGSGSDVRITTRTSESDPFNCIYSTIHEVGHATYELGIRPEYAMTPLGQGVSLGVHESQSRIYENQLGRSRAFTGWLFDRMCDTYGTINIPDGAAFYAAANRVEKGYIRTEADEVQYNLHIMLRFELERALMFNDLQVGDLEAAWNDRFLADFGYPVDRPSHGMLQDVHWSVGIFGYFPTYALGNVYAGCLHEALRQAVPTLDSDLAKGETGQATKWLRDNVQCHGGLYTPRDLIRKATGTEPSEKPLLDYLETKFSDLYRL